MSLRNAGIYPDIVLHSYPKTIIGMDLVIIFGYTKGGGCRMTEPTCALVLIALGN
jgi:hypothetical protein